MELLGTFVCAAGLAVAANSPVDPPADLVPRPLSVSSQTYVDHVGPIARWDEAMPLGNGLLGGLLWGEKNVLKLSLDRGDLWDLRMPERLTQPDWTYATMIRLKEEKKHAQHIEMFDTPYEAIPYPTKIPAGRVEFVLPERIELGGFYVRLGWAEATAHWSKSLRSRATCTFSPDEPVAALWLYHFKPDEVGIRILRADGLDKLQYGPAERGESLIGETKLIWLEQKGVSDNRFAVAVGLRPENDNLIATVSVETGTDARTKALAWVLKTLDAPSTALERRSSEWWDQFWEQSSVWVPDIDIREHYDLCKYLFGSASRPGSPPIPLQGVWTADEGGLPPWKGDYHNDLNTQMTYGAYPEAGLFECGRSWIDFNWNLLPRYRRFAREFYGLTDKADQALVPGVMALDGSPMGGWGQYSLSPTHSAWVAQSFYLHWKYTNDQQFLRDRAFPFCEAVGNALLGLAHDDGAGHLRLSLSSSPEIHDNSYAAWLPPNSNYDLSLMRFLFGALEEMAGTMNNAATAAKWHEALAKLEPLDVDPSTHALTFARGHPYAESHRHFSHAMAIYPLGTLNIDGTDEDRRTIAATLDQLEARGTKAWCGYSFAWFSAMAARAGQGERALKYLKTYQRAFTGPNGFHLNGDQTKSGLSDFTYRPFTLEGNFIAMAAVQEMLMQSWGGVIRVFPAVSKDWQDAWFEDLHAEGGWRVSAHRDGGKTVRVKIIADHAGKVRIRDPFADSGRAAEWSIPGKLVGRDWEFDLESGNVLVGTPAK